MPSARAVRCSRWTSRGSAGGRVRRMPDAGVDHERRRAHAGQERDLGVPGLDGREPAELQLPVAVLLHQLLLGQRQGHTTARGLARQSQLADLLQQPHQLAPATGVDVGLDALVGQLGTRAHQGALDVDVVPLAGLVDLDRPQQRGPGLVGQQRRRALAQHRRVQRDLRVSAVERLAATVGLDVDRVPGRRRRPRRPRSRSGRRSRPLSRGRARCASPGRGPWHPRGRS